MKIKNIAKWVFLLIIVVVGLWLNDYLNNRPQDLYYTKVIKVIDGDTFLASIDDRAETIRMIGVDTPESVHHDKNKNSELGLIASKYTKNYLEEELVGLEFDLQERDKYGRVLAYVFIDKELFNEKILQDGMGRIMTIAPNTKYEKRFIKAQNYAIKNKKGFWK